MNSKKRIILSLALAAAMSLAVVAVQAGHPAQKPGPMSGSSAQATLGTSFTYQGRLASGDEPVSGDCSMAFRLYDAAASGNQVGSALTHTVPISDGLFTVNLDFGDPIVDGTFAGDARWLGIGVKCPGDADYADLGRQELTATPYALYARSTGALHAYPVTSTAPTPNQVLKWDGSAWAPASDETSGGGGDITGVHAGSGLSGGGTGGDVTLSADTSYLQQRVSSTCAAGSSIRGVSSDGTVTCETDDDTTYSAGTGLNLSGTQFRITTAYRLPQGCTGGQIAEWNGSAWVCGDDDAGASGDTWSLSGNAGTTPSAHFLGTTDGVSLTLAVSGTAALRLEPSATSPNLIGGYGGNTVAPGVAGATIGGGGSSDQINEVTGNYGTVGGGFGNTASGPRSTVGGGLGNTASHVHTTVGGGYHNAAGNSNATVGGGRDNIASGSTTTIGGGRYNTADGLRATIGGGEYISVTGQAATVAGGSHITVTGDYAAVGGGADNTAGGWSTVGGGEGNTAEASATVGGGVGNHAVGWSTVGGGYYNYAPVGWSTVGGGKTNRASNYYATVGGGASNTASGGGSTVGGGVGNTASGSTTTIGGGYMNHADALIATVGGGEYISVTGEAATVAGGSRIIVTGDYAAVGGGADNTASGVHATVSGGQWNEASSNYATIGGGEENTASGWSATVGGGHSNTASNHYATVGGGTDNTATYTNTTVSGGQWNAASADFATVGGGGYNTASGLGSIVGGGGYNDAIGAGATVGGGHSNIASGDSATVGGGDSNTADAWAATVGGGLDNTASNWFATVPGGRDNTAASDYSFAAGRRAKANHFGAFVWGDSTDADVTSPAPNSFIVRASGGVTMYTSSGLSSGAVLPAGSGGWSALSDRNAKVNLAPVDGQQILAQLADLPITTWNYRAQGQTARHMGPMAQDFYAAFGLGESERYISTIDADGVALAAIQGLYIQNQNLTVENTALQERVDALRQQNANLEARVAALEITSANGTSPADAAPSQGSRASLLTWAGILLPWAGVLLAAVGLAWASRRRGGLGAFNGGGR